MFGLRCGLFRLLEGLCKSRKGVEKYLCFVLVCIIYLV